MCQRARILDPLPGSYRIRSVIGRRKKKRDRKVGRRCFPFSFSSTLTFFSFHPLSSEPFPPAGLANEKTVDITAAPGGGVAIRTSRPKNISKPSKATATSVSKKTSARRVAAAAGKAAASLRPDLKRAAAAKASALMRASRARKANSKGGAAVVAADE